MAFIKDYKMLCRTCHNYFDRRIGNRPTFKCVDCGNPVISPRAPRCSKCAPFEWHKRKGHKSSK